MNIDALVAEIRRDHLARPPASAGDLARARELGLPDDLQRFHELSDGAYLHACDKYGGYCEVEGRWWRWKILPVRSIESIAEIGYVNPRSSLHERTRRWLAVVDIQDSNYLAISTEPDHTGEAIDCFHETVGEPGSNKIVAKSFTELLASLLRSPEELWLGDGSPNYGYH